LLDPVGQVRPRVAVAIEKAKLAGCQIVLATGRRLPSATPIARRVGVSVLILTDGTVVYDLESGQAIFERALDPVGQRRAVEMVVEAGIQPILLESPAAGGLILTGPAENDNLESDSYLGRRSDVRRMSYDELTRAERIVTALALGDRNRVERLASQAAGSAMYTLVYWTPSAAGYSRHTLSLAPANTSKGNALAWLAARWGFGIDETMAVGDYDNDVSLIATAGIGIAMGNAVESVKAVARAIVADNEHDGVAQAIEEWVLSG
jgi:Cof subfamily protein (haloacid dehalogenase superfamily)